MLIPGVVDTEQIDPPPGPGTLGDIDTFTFEVPAGSVGEIVLQKIDTGAAGMGGTISRGDSRWIVRPGNPSDDFETFASAQLQPAQYQVEFDADAYSLPEGEPDNRYRGAYRVELYLIDSLPEHASAAITPGTPIVDEAIDHVGDVDAYTLAGPPGTMYNAFVSAPGSPPHVAELDVFVSGLISMGEQVAATDTALMTHAIGRFTMPQSGKVNVRVWDPGKSPGLYRGPYHLMVARIDSAPETVPPVLTPGAGADSESIDVIGDHDEYSLTLNSPALVNLRLARLAAASGSGLTATLYAGGSEVTHVMVDPASTSRSTINMPLAAGSYRLAVEPASSQTGGFVGPYAVEARVVDEAPEKASAQLAVGDSVTAEAVDYAGDVDEFLVHTQAADTFRVSLQPPPGDTLHGEVVDILDAAADTAISPANGIIGAPAAADFRVRVVSRGNLSDTEARQPYRLAVLRSSAGPETASSALMLDDSVSSERIDFTGDVDDFFLQAAPGTNLVFRAGGLRAPGTSGAVRFHVTDSGTPDTIPVLGDVGFGPATSDNLVVSSAGMMRVRVSGDSVGYWLEAIALDTLPEGRGAAIAIGDSVSESLATYGDIDTYTFSATAGARINVRFGSSPIGSNDGYRLSVIDGSTGAVLGTVDEDNSNGPVSLTGLVLPTTGTYEVRVQHHLVAALSAGYWFQLTPSP